MKHPSFAQAGERSGIYSPLNRELPDWIGANLSTQPVPAQDRAPSMDRPGYCNTLVNTYREGTREVTCYLSECPGEGHLLPGDILSQVVTDGTEAGIPDIIHHLV